MTSKSKQETPLLRFLRNATKAERDRVAELSRTPVGYLYQLAAPEGREPKVGLALRISRATARVAAESNGRLEQVDVADLARLH